MHMVIKCNECNHKFSWPIDKAFIVEQCPECGMYFSADITLIDVMADNIANSVSRLNHIIVEGIYTGDEETRIHREITSSVFGEALNSLGSIYQAASSETQECLKKIIDSLYLLIKGDAEDENAAKLEQTYRQIHDLWNKKFDSPENNL